MTERSQPDLSDERLRAAFASAGGVDIDSADAERIWLAVTGALSAEEVRDVVEETAADPAKAMAWRIAKELFVLQAAEQTSAGREPVAGAVEGASEERDPGVGWAPTNAPVVESPANDWRNWAVAASLLTAACLGVLAVQQREMPPAVRGSDTAIEALTTEPCETATCTFAWAAVAGVQEYRFRLLTEDLRVLAEERVPGTELELSKGVLDEVDSGTTLLWSVEALDAAGSSTASSTFRRTVILDGVDRRSP